MPTPLDSALAGNAPAQHIVGRDADPRRFGDALRQLRDGEAEGRTGPVEGHVERAILFAGWGRLPEAARHAAYAIGGRPKDLRRLSACIARLADARIPVAAALDIGDGEADLALVKMQADILRSQNRFSDAIPLLRRSLDAARDDVVLSMALADCLIASGRDAEALECLERVVRIAPDHSVAWAHIAAIHTLAGRYDSALQVCEHHRFHDERIRAEAVVNHAITRFHAGDSTGCLSQLLSFLPTDPVITGHMQLGPVLLARGVWDEGWRQYEFRWLTGAFASERPNGSSPHWNGQDLDGRTVLVVREQGIGDFFQFARYIPMLQARGARVILQSFAGVASIANRLFPDAVVLEEGDEIPRHDYFAFLMSLPRAFGAAVAAIPGPVPGLAPLPERAEFWKAALPASSRMRVGVVWAGRPEHLRDRQRSMALEALAPVLAIPGIQFVGLQKGPAVAQCEALPDRLDWTSLGPALDTLEDAIAVLDRIDVLVTVDTALAHIAATMGKPVWMLVTSPPDFRWRDQGDATPWYPSMRIFRQRVPGRWSDPVREVVAALTDRRDQHAERRPPSAAGPARETPGAFESSFVRPLGLARALPMRHGFLQYDPDEPLVGASLEQYGEWLEPVLERVQASLAEGDVVVEANPGIGTFSLPIASKVGLRGDLLLFEPRSGRRRMLANNLRAHRIAHASLLGRALVGSAAEIGACADTVDDLGLPRLDMLLLHVAEVPSSPIVEGASETLWRCRPDVVAMAESESALEAPAACLRDHGYVVERLQVPVFSRGNFNRQPDDRTDGKTCAVLIAQPEEGRARPR